MALPPLPANRADTWDIGTAFESEGSIMSVSAHAGRVLVGGRELRRMRAGDQGWQKRELPARIGMVWKVAQESRAPFRQAVASESGVAIFLGAEGDGRIAHIRPIAEGVYVTNLAWGRAGQKSVLFILWDNGEVVRLVPGEGKHETLALPPMTALAADGAGWVALLAWEEMRVYVTDGGPRFWFRRIDFTREWYDALPPAIEDPMHLAVAGRAVALSIGWSGAWVTRELETMPFEKIEPLAAAGALAFEGSSPDAALFGAVNDEAKTSVVRVDAYGRAVRLGDMLIDHGRAYPFDEIAWDATRRRLFAVHRQAGLVVATAPDAKGAKLAAPN
jgi:hypothetical protein